VCDPRTALPERFLGRLLAGKAVVPAVRKPMSQLGNPPTIGCNGFERQEREVNSRLAPSSDPRQPFTGRDQYRLQETGAETFRTSLLAPRQSPRGLRAIRLTGPVSSTRAVGPMSP